MKRGIIFDMDGTLWDSAENVAKSWNVAIRQYGVREKELTTQDIQGVMGKTMDVIADILFAEFPEEKRRLLIKNAVRWKMIICGSMGAYSTSRCRRRSRR